MLLYERNILQTTENNLIANSSSQNRQLPLVYKITICCESYSLPSIWSTYYDPRELWKKITSVHMNPAVGLVRHIQTGIS